MDDVSVCADVTAVLNGRATRESSDAGTPKYAPSKAKGSTKYCCISSANVRPVAFSKIPPTSQPKVKG